ncbi:hypothetical protein [Microcoleus sp. B4-D4]|uniref:hypothetical protein n=1 Tax=Microcoleus sp. B4-D4 TaxID=2818667 RepID=UPI002FCFD6AD
MKTQLSIINSTVKAYLFNAKGQVDGWLLSDGKQLHLPPHHQAMQSIEKKAKPHAIEPSDKV